MPKRREVGLDEAVVLLVEAAQHRGPGALQDQQALPFVDRLALATRRPPAASTPGNGVVAEPGLVAVIPGSGVIMIAPVSVCHQVSTIGQRPPPITSWYQSQALGLIGSPTEPSSRSEERSCFGGDLRAPLDEGADRGRRRVEDRRLVALDQLPPDPLVRVVGRPLPHHAGGAVGERAVDDVGVAGDPADVGGAPVDVGLGLEVEDVAVGGGDAGHVAAGGVEDPLRLRGRAGGVEDVERVLGLHRLGRALGVGRRQHLVVEDVAALAHRALDPGVADDDDRLQRARWSPMCSSTAGLIGAVLPLRRAPSTVTSAFASENSIRSAHRLGREAAEDDVVEGADPGAGEHRDDDLGDHRQVDPDHVALLDAEVLERVGEALDVAVQVGVGDVALLPLLAAPVVGDAVADAGLDVAVEAVGARRSAARRRTTCRRAGWSRRAPRSARRPSRAAPSPAPVHQASGSAAASS